MGVNKGTLAKRLFFSSTFLQSLRDCWQDGRVSNKELLKDTSSCAQSNTNAMETTAQAPFGQKKKQDS